MSTKIQKRIQRKSNTIFTLLLTGFLTIAVIVVGFLAGREYLENNSTKSEASSVQSLVAFGSSAYGLLGDGFDSNVTTPQQVSNVTGVDGGVQAGVQHSVAVRSDGRVYAWGHNGYGQLGQGNTTPRSTAVFVKDSSNNDFTDVVQVSAASYYSMAVKNDGTVWGWGSIPNIGQFTNPTQITGLPSIRKVVAHGYSTFYVTDTNVIYASGGNYGTKLGIGNSDNNFATATPTLIAGLTDVRDFDIVTTDENGSQYDVPVAVKNDNTVWTWGFGLEYTNCAPPDRVILVPTVPTFDTCRSPYQVLNPADGSGFLQNVSKIASRVSSIFEYIGTDGNVYYIFRGGSAPVLRPELTGLGVTEIVGGGDSVYYITATEQVYVTGFNNNGQSGLGTQPGTATSIPTLIPSLTGITAIASDATFTLFQKDDGTVWAVGNNGSGQLGINTSARDALIPQPINSPNLPPASIVDIQATANIAIFLKNDGTVWSLGSGSRGKLGTGNNNDSAVPVQVSGLTGITKIANGASGEYTLALKNDGTVWGWGANDVGQLGNGTNIDTNTPTQVINSVTDLPVTNAVDIGAGRASSGIILNNGNVLTFGDNGRGLLSLGDNVNRNKATLVNPSLLNNIIEIDFTRAFGNFINSSGTLFVSGAIQWPFLEVNLATPISGNTAPLNFVNCGDFFNTTICEYKDTNNKMYYRGESNGTNLVQFGAPLDSDVVKYGGDITGYGYIKSDGIFYNLGKGNNGQLGNGGNITVNSIVQPLNLTNVSLFAKSNSNTYAVGYIVQPLDGSNIPLVQGLTYTCNPIVVESTTTCSFVLPANTSLPNDFKIGIGNSTPGGNCAQDSQNYSSTITVNCTGVPVGTLIGSQSIFVQFGNASPINTGETTTISPRAFTNGDVAFLTTLTSLNCVPANPASNDSISCNGTIPAYITPPSSLSLNVTGQSAVACTFTGQSYSCPNLPVGSSTGIKIVQGQANSSVVTDTDKTINVGARVFDAATDIPTLGALTGLSCNPSTVGIGNTTTCTGSIPSNVIPPSTLSLNVNGQPAIPCIISGQNYACSSLTVGTTLGPISLQARSGSSTTITTDVSITVTPRAFDNVNDIANLSSLASVTCTPNNPVAGSTISCNGTLPSIVTPPSSLTIGVTGQAQAPCTFTGQAFTCTNIAVGNNSGSINLQAAVGSATPANIGGTVTISPRPFNPSTDLAALSILAGLTCTPSNPLASQTITCNGTLPNYVTPPSNLTVGATGQAQAPCTFTGQAFTCTNVAVGNATGASNIQAAIGSGTPVNTGVVVNIGTRPFDPVNDIANLGSLTNLTCTPNNPVAGSTISCSGTLPTYIAPPSTITVGLNGQPQVPCVFTGQAFTCANVTVGDTLGSNGVQSTPGSGNPVNVGNTVTVIQRPFDPEIDLQSLLTAANLVCTPTTTTTFSATTCSGTLPASITAPTNLAFNVEGAKGKAATFTGQAFTVTNLDTGTIVGTRKIQAQLFSDPSQLAYTPGTKLDTGSTIIVTPKPLGNTDLSNIGTNTTNDPFSSFSCNNGNTVTSGTTSTTCTGTLKTSYSLPSDLKIGFDNSNVNGTCTISGQSVTCTNVSVPTAVGVYNLRAFTAGQTTTATYRLTVVANPTTATPVLPRTGGFAIFGILSIIVLAGGTFIAIKKTRNESIEEKIK